MNAKCVWALGGLLLGSGCGWWMHRELVSQSTGDSMAVIEPALKEVAEAQPVGDDPQLVRTQMLQLAFDDRPLDSRTAQLNALLALGAHRPVGGVERVQFDLLARFLAESDPLALYHWAECDRSMDSPFREAIMNQALGVLAVRAPQQAFKIVHDMSSYWHRQRAYQELFAEMSMAYSGAELLDIVEHANLSIFEGWRYGDIAAILAKEDPDGVFDVIEKRFPEMQQKDAYLYAIKSIAEEDFSRAQRMASGLEGRELAATAKQVLCGQALQSGDLATAEAMLAEEPPSADKDNVLRSLVYDARSLSIEESIRLIDQYASNGAKMNMLNELYARSVVDAPESLGLILADKIRPQDRSNFLHSLAWRVRDADLFEATYQALESPEDKSDFLDQYLSSGSYSDASEMATLFIQKQSEVSHNWAAKRIASRLASYDPQAALEFAAKVTDEAQQKVALKGVVDEWFAQDPEAAWVWLAAQESANPADVEFNQELQRRAIRALSENDPLAALDYVDAIVDPAFQGAVRKGVLPNLFQEDAGKAIEYIEEVTALDARDATYTSVAKGIQYATPDLALLAALQIRDIDESDQLCQQIIKRWQGQRSATHVMETIDAMDISEAQKEKLMQSL